MPPVPLALGRHAGGTRVGTLVHAVLERVDFAAPDLAGELDAGPAHELLAAPSIWATSTTSSPGLWRPSSRRSDRWRRARGLRDVRRRDRLDELSFELPLVGGDDPAAGEVARVAD